MAEVQRLWNAGLGGTEIARKLGLSRNTVIGKITRMKWPRGAPLIREARPKRQPRPRPPPQVDPSRKAPSFPLEPMPVTATATIFELPRFGRCKWPIGDPALDGFGYCGRAAPDAGPYCPVHKPLAHAPRASSTPQELLRSVRRYL